MGKWIINKTIYHLKSGTFMQTAIREIRLLKRKWCNYIWQRRSAYRESEEFLIQKQVLLRLYYDSKLSKWIRCENFESGEREFVNSFLKPGDIFIDIGANIGLFTIIAANKVGNIGKVYSFEPTPISYRRLCENIELNSYTNVLAYQFAVSDANEQKELFISKDGHDAWNSLAKPFNECDTDREKVTCIRLDDFIDREDLKGKVSLVKIDVEGWEKMVLAGGDIFLRDINAPVLMVEFTDEAAISAGSSCESLYMSLEQLGYRMFSYIAGSMQIKSEPLRKNYPNSNLLAIKNLHLVENRLNVKFPGL